MGGHYRQLEYQWVVHSAVYQQFCYTYIIMVHGYTVYVLSINKVIYTRSEYLLFGSQNKCKLLLQIFFFISKKT
jgi:hypothetical protein